MPRPKGRVYWCFSVSSLVMLDMLASLGEGGRRENAGARVSQLWKERRHALRKGLAGRKSSVGLFRRKSSACRARSRKLFSGRNFALALAREGTHRIRIVLEGTGG